MSRTIMPVLSLDLPSFVREKCQGRYEELETVIDVCAGFRSSYSDEHDKEVVSERRVEWPLGISAAVPYADAGGRAAGASRRVG